MPPKRDRSPSGKGAAQAFKFESLSADQKKGVGRLVASLALQYHNRKEILESVDISKSVKDFLGLPGEVRLKLDDVRVAVRSMHSNITHFRYFLLPMMYYIQKFACALLKCVVKAQTPCRSC